MSADLAVRWTGLEMGGAMQSGEASTIDQAPRVPTESRAKYAAFVSYRHAPIDSGRAAWIIQALEQYRTPRPLVLLGYPAKLGKLFRDEEEAGAGGHLKMQIVQALEDSAWLILLISPRTATSDWIKLEILEFVRTHPVSRILPLTIEGDPQLAVRLVSEVLGAQAAAELPLGADIRARPNERDALRRHKAVVRLAAAILGCQYDDLARRDEQRALRRTRLWQGVTVGAAAFLAAGVFTWWDLNVRVKTHWYRQVEEQWGKPVGRGELSEGEARHRRSTYRCRSRKGQVFEVARVNGRGYLLADSQFEPFEDPGTANVARWTYRYYEDGLPALVEQLDDRNVLLRRVSFQFLPDRTLAIARFERSFGIAQRDAANGGSLDTLFRTDAASRSQIGQHRLHFDHAGHLLRRDFEPVGGGPVMPDSMGSFGRLYEYDHAGRVVGMSSADASGTRLKGVVGQAVSIKAVWHDEEVAEVGWFDSAQVPARNAGGVAKVRIERDRWGNMLKETFLDGQGKALMSERWRYVAKRYAYDNQGGQTSSSIEDQHGQKALAYGIHREQHVLDMQGRQVQTRFFDLQGRPTPSHRLGCAAVTRSWDERGFMVAWNCLDKAGRPFPERESGAAGTRWKNDPQGRSIEISHIGTDGLLSGGKKGIALARREFDLNGNVVRWMGFDAKLQATAQSDNGFSDIRYRFDSNGNRIELAGYGQDGKLASNPTEHWSVLTQDYDEKGNVVIKRWVDRHRQRAINAVLAASTQRIQYFDSGYVKSSSVFGLNDEPVVGKSCHRWEYTRDAAGRPLEVRCFDGAGKPALDLDGGGHRVQLAHGPMGWTRRSLYGTHGERMLGLNDQVATIIRELDAEGRETLRRHFGAQGEPVLDADEGVHAVRVVFDPAGHPVERMTYDTAMHLSPAKDDDAAWRKSIFDAVGNEIETRYFGPTNQPIRNHEFGAHVMRQRYDALGQVVEQTFFDEHNRPVRCTDDGAHRVRKKYDAYGGQIEEAYFDEADNPVLELESGAAIKRWVLTPDGKNLREAYFGTDGAPTRHREKQIHAWIRDRDPNGNLVRLRSIDVDGKLIPDRESGVSDSRRVYDVYGRMIDKMRFDAQGRPATSREDEISRWRYAYDERGHETLAVSFGVDGRVLRAKDRKCAATLSEYGPADEPKAPRCVLDWKVRLDSQATPADVGNNPMPRP